MMMLRLGYPVLLVCLLALSGQGTASAEDGTADQPLGSWTQADGGPGRARSVATPPLTGPLEEAWVSKFEHTIVGQPLVWDGKIIVQTLSRRGHRELHMVDLATGKPSGKPLRIKASQDLLPALWRGRLAVRAGESSFRVYRIGKRRLTRIFDRDLKKAQVKGLTIVGKRVYCQTQYGCMYFVNGTEPAVQLGFGLLRSNAVLHGDGANGVIYDSAGNAHLHYSPLDPRRSNELVFLGHHGGRVPKRPAHVARSHDTVLVTLGADLELNAQGSANLVVVRWEGPGHGWRLQTVLDVMGKPCAGEHYWAALIDEGREGRKLVRGPTRMDQERRVAVLATRELHPELLESEHLTMAGDVLFVGRHRVNLDSLEIYDPLPFEPTGAVVPVHDTLLASSGPKRLVALRERKSGDHADERLLGSGSQAEPVPAVVVTKDGGVRKVELVWEGGGVSIKGKPLVVEDALLVRADDGRIVFAPSPDLAVEGFRHLIDQREARGYATLATNAVKARDPVLAARYAAAADDGGEGKSVSLWTRRRMEALERPGHNKPPIPERVAEVLAEEKALKAASADLVWSSYVALGKDAPWSTRAALLRAVLTRVPDHAKAADEVRAAIPAGVPLPDGFVAADWLLLADAVQTDPAQRADPQGPDRLAFLFAKKTWRGDVTGIRSKNLLILTPKPDPAQIAACLATGELVCRTLQGLFGKPNTDRAPLVLHLFPNRKAYIEASGGGGGQDSMLSMSAGHYVPGLSLSRIFLPAGEDPFGEVFETYAHELVHHWLDARCPLPRTKNLRGHDATTPCFWLVEGIAELFAEFAYDLRRGKVETANRRAASLDAVAHAPAERILPWKYLLSMDQRTFARLDTKVTVPVTLRWRAGLRREMTQVALFYAQSTAVAQYLFNKSPKTREQLIELVRLYYEGSLKVGDVERVLGVSLQELGRAVTAYARSAR